MSEGRVRARQLARDTVIALAAAAGVLGLALAIAGPGLLAGEHRSAGRTTAVVVGLGVWLASFVLERRRAARIAIFTPLLAGVALSALAVESGGFLHGSLTDGRSEQTWNVYHYYMGSKYYPELGFGELYAAHLAADDEDGHRDYGFVRKGRSMATFQETPRAELVAHFDRRALFSEARWAEFKHDVHAFRPLLPKDKWRGVLIDLGYHPSPAWTIVGTPFANLVSVRGAGWWWLVNSDLLLHALSLVLMVWAFGPRTTALAVLWLAATPLNSTNFTGGFLRHDWLHSALIAVALWHRGKAGWAGVALSWGAMTRVFPGLIAVPLMLRAGRALVRGGPRAVSPAHRAFLVALTLACAVLFGAAHLTGRGAATWPEWTAIILQHGHLHPATSNRRVGVGRLAMHEPRARDFFGTRRGASFEEQIQKSLGRRWGIQIAGLVLLVAAAWRRRDLDAMILMTFGVFLLATLSRYHGSIFVLLFFLGARGAKDPTPWPAMLAGGALLLGVALFQAARGVTAQYYVFNYEVLAMFLVLCAAYVAEDRRASRRAERHEGVEQRL